VAAGVRRSRRDRRHGECEAIFVTYERLSSFGIVPGLEMEIPIALPQGHYLLRPRGSRRSSRSLQALAQLSN